MGKWDKPKPKTKELRINVFGASGGVLPDTLVEVEFEGTYFHATTNSIGLAKVTVPFSTYACNLFLFKKGYENFTERRDLTANTVQNFYFTLKVKENPVPEFLEPIVISNKKFKTESNQPFQWRSITWFRLIHQVANGEDVSYLAHLKELGFNSVRILSTAKVLFDLPPEKGREFLSTTLNVLESHGLYAEVVACVDTAKRSYDFKAHARAVAITCELHSNAFFEFANEPWHSVQDPELHDLEHVTELARQATSGLNLPYSAGTPTTDEPNSDGSIPNPIGDYLTPHLDRGRPGWEQIRRVRELENLMQVSGLPVVNNEPIGFDEQDGSVTGRQRFNNPEYALGLGVLGRIFTIGTTFHCQAGLQCDPLGPIQEKCAEDFIIGNTIIPDDEYLTFKNATWVDSPVDSFEDCVRVYSGLGPNKSIVCALGTQPTYRIIMKNGYRLGNLLIDRNEIKVWELL